MSLAEIPSRRTWRLEHRYQLDQGQTPECVAYTGKHWERALPVCKPTALSPDALYQECKKLDGDIEEGTTGRTLLKVYQKLGHIGAYFWADPNDPDAIWQWLLTRGPMWLGAFWTKSMLYPDRGGLLRVEGPFQYGHETLLIGGNRRKGTVLGVNSWGRSWAFDGRFVLSFEHGLLPLLANEGDLAGVEEVAA